MEPFALRSIQESTSPSKIEHKIDKDMLSNLVSCRHAVKLLEKHITSLIALLLI